MRPRVVVFIADNDKAGSAQPTVKAAQASLGLEICYVIESTPGVVHARNASVQAAVKAGVDVVVSIDDDEVPHDCWLGALLLTQQRTGAMIVGGPVVEVVEALPDWYRRSRFYQPPDLADGAPAPYAACGNALFMTAAILRVEGPFDPRFNTSGGEDVFLSLQLARMDLAIVWSPDARVETSVPIERAALRHVARRHYIGAANFTRAERILDGPRVRRLGTGLVRIARGVLIGVGGVLVLSKYRSARGVVGIAEGAGVISGALGRGGQRAWWAT